MHTSLWFWCWFHDVGDAEKSTVQFSHSVVSDSLLPHGLQHARLPCPLPTPGSYSDSCPSRRWGFPIVSSSVIPFSLLPPSIYPSTRVFSNASVLHITWPKYWSFSFSISPSSEYSGLIFFQMHWLDLLAVQGRWTFPTPQLSVFSHGYLLLTI